MPPRARSVLPRRRVLAGLRAHVGVLALVMAALAPATAAAQTPSEIATARQWFADGLAREESGDYPAALALFRRTIQVKRTPQIAYHVAFCESRTGALVLALVDLESAATLARSVHADDVVIAIEAELADVRKRIPTLEVHDASGKASRFVVDGNAVSLAMVGTPMPLDPGPHTVAIELPSGASATKEVTLVERDKKVVDLAPQAVSLIAPVPAPPVAIASAPAPSAPPEPVASHASSRPLPWVLVVGGGAAVVAGVAMYADAWVQEGNLHSQCPSRTGCPSSLQGTYSSAKTLDGVGLGVGLVGLAALGVGVSLLVFQVTPATTAHVDLTPRGAALTGTF